MVTPKVNMEPEDPSVPGRESTTETESEKQLRMFVTMLTVRVLYKCNTLKSHSQEKWATHMKRLVNQTMEGVTVAEGFCPDVKRRRNRKQLLEAVIVVEDPFVDTAIVQCSQGKGTSHCWWKDAFQIFVFATGLLADITFSPV
ncbi:hypothetical protein GBF38_018740 [Nibea albiflora]|uniref:Uncharacterized protein n=1 Tax=Nibea albiflora TaxID=240163 RepID=A0ACB7ENR0_NIBAL|nr:hypothetical protein GBF38_018740 [Nibea albiflora]